MTVRYRQIAALLIGTVLGSVLLMLSGCSVPEIDRFKKGKPSLSLAEFFASGNSECILTAAQNRAS